MQQNTNKNLLIIYQDTPKNLNTGILNSLFDVMIVPKVAELNLQDFKLKGNPLVTSYNDILYATDPDLVFFISSSEFNNQLVKKFLSFNGLDKDFDFFLSTKKYTLISSLSGLVVKKEVLLRMGFLGKHTFNNLYLNFLINYSLFYGMVPEYAFHKLKIASRDFKTYSYWNYYEDKFYQSNPLYKNIYISIGPGMDAALTNNFIKKRIASSMKKKMSTSLSEIDNFIYANTFLAYW
ncbi:MAG TPA: hypothetical protein PKW80_04435 [Bacteroidales bacterium]|mgnify:CR=1 FL=1|nr:hypothetical protein [Bacteroidales bacterium]